MLLKATAAVHLSHSRIPFKMRSKTDSRQCNRPGGIALRFSGTILSTQERALHTVLFASHALEGFGKAMARGIIGIGAAVRAGDGIPMRIVFIIALHRIGAHADLRGGADGSAGKRNVDFVTARFGERNAIAIEIIACASVIFVSHCDRSNADQRNNDQNKCQITFHVILLSNSYISAQTGRGRRSLII